MKENNNQPVHFLSVPPLEVVQLRLRFEAPEGLHLRSFNASAWRGMLGHALRRTACVTGQRSCQGCLLKSSCAYSYLFETAPPADADRMRSYPAVPHPIVIRNIDCAGELPAGGGLHLEVLLFGKGREYLLYLLHAFELGARQGFGAHRQPLELTRVEALNRAGQWAVLWVPGHSVAALPSSLLRDLPPLPHGAIQVELSTPLRIQHEGRLVGPDRLTPAILWRSLTRRLSMLSYFHGKTPVDADFRGLHRLAEGLDWGSRKLRFQDWKRYSSRQKRLIAMHGLVGDLTIDLTEAEALWPWLWWGQWLHVGKGAVMGLGRYVLHHRKLVGMDAE